MLRLLVFAAPLLAVAGILPAAPVPPDAGKQLYFPTKVGTKWVYESTSGNGWGSVITESEGNKGRTLITVKATSVDFKDEPGTTFSQYEVSKDGVFLIADELDGPASRKKYDPPLCILKLPHKVSEKWTNQQKAANADEYVTGKIETIKVPAGTFEAIRVEHGEKHTLWYAPGGD